MANATHVYHWKHGWIPLDHVAALSKAKGNHVLAARYMADAHGGEAGIHNRRDVARAIIDLPNVPASDRNGARASVVDAAHTLGAADLLPGRNHSQSKHVADLTDSELEDEMSSLMGDPNGFDNPRMDALAREMDARDARQRHASEMDALRQEALDQEHERNRLGYGAGGKVWRRDKGNSLRAIRDEYETFVEVQFVSADQELNGVLLSPAGRHAAQRGDLDVRDLFTKRRRDIRKWASEELQQWFAHNPRMSFPEFRAGAVADDPGRAARQRFRDRGWESEFG